MINLTLQFWWFRQLITTVVVFREILMLNINSVLEGSPNILSLVNIQVGTTRSRSEVDLRITCELCHIFCPVASRLVFLQLLFCVVHLSQCCQRWWLWAGCSSAAPCSALRMFVQVARALSTLLWGLGLSSPIWKAAATVCLQITLLRTPGEQLNSFAFFGLGHRLSKAIFSCCSRAL